MSTTDLVDQLTVEYLGEEHVLGPGDSLRFGRSADLVIDDNPFMHRVVGRFVHREGVWWLQNQGTKSHLELRDSGHGSALSAAPGQQVPIVGSSFAVRFMAGPTTYELTGTRVGANLVADEDGTVLGTATVEFAKVPMSTEQHLLVVAMYESQRRCGQIEPNAVIAERLGWTTSKFNRKLDAVCDKLARAGVRNMRGRKDSQAGNRRDALVSHALTAGLVGPDDVALLRGVMSSS